MALNEEGDRIATLRREARQLEGEIDGQLLALAKAVPPTDTDLMYGERTVTTPAAESSEWEGIAAAAAATLDSLRAVNDELRAEANARGSSGALSAALKRHENILLDYEGELRRTRENVAGSWERAELLASVRSDIKAGANQRTGADALLGERSSLLNSHNNIDETLARAAQTQADLSRQADFMRSIQTNLGNLTSGMPDINSLIGNIGSRQTKNKLILAGVCAFCWVWYLVWFFRV